MKSASSRESAEAVRSKRQVWYEDKFAGKPFLK